MPTFSLVTHFLQAEGPVFQRVLLPHASPYMAHCLFLVIRIITSNMPVIYTQSFIHTAFQTKACFFISLQMHPTVLIQYGIATKKGSRPGIDEFPSCAYR